MQAVPNILYIISVVLLIYGLRRLSSPASAHSGNFIAAIGMGLAILTTLFVPLEKGSDNYHFILAAIAFVIARLFVVIPTPLNSAIAIGIGAGLGAGTRGSRRVRSRPDRMTIFKIYREFK